VEWVIGHLNGFTRMMEDELSLWHEATGRTSSPFPQLVPFLKPLSDQLREEKFSYPLPLENLTREIWLVIQALASGIEGTAFWYKGCITHLGINAFLTF